MERIDDQEGVVNGQANVDNGSAPGCNAASAGYGVHGPNLQQMLAFARLVIRSGYKP